MGCRVIRFKSFVPAFFGAVLIITIALLLFMWHQHNQVSDRVQIALSHQISDLYVDLIRASRDLDVIIADPGGDLELRLTTARLALGSPPTDTISALDTSRYNSESNAWSHIFYGIQAAYHTVYNATIQWHQTQEVDPDTLERMKTARDFLNIAVETLRFPDGSTTQEGLEHVLDQERLSPLVDHAREYSSQADLPGL